jgi:FkbM family methyltransferase
MMLVAMAQKIVRLCRTKWIQVMHREPRWYKVSAGFWMFINPKEWLGRMVLLGYYEPHLVYFISQVCQEGDVCLDIGAHQGYIALHLARRVGAAGRVLAIEPVDSNFERLTLNVQRNHAAQIRCVHCAAGNRTGQIEIWYNPVESGHASAYYRPCEQASRIQVQVETADEIIERHIESHLLERISFIKIDVEGFEPLVLQGLRRTLQRYQPILWIEKNPPCLQAGGFCVADIVKPICEHGYQIYEINFHYNFFGTSDFTLIPSDLESQNFNMKFDDIVAVVPQSKGWERIRCSRIQIR